MHDPVLLTPLEAWSQALLRLNLDPRLQSLALELARWPKDLESGQRRQVALMALFLLIAESQGSTLLPIEGPELDSLKTLFQAPDLDLRSLLADPRLALLVSTASEIRPFMLDEQGLSTGRHRAAEAFLAAWARSRPAASSGIVPDPVDALSEEQRKAARAAAVQPLTLVTGGPGTGKTSIVLAILRAATQSGLEPAEIALAAPTGRAATRMGQVIQAFRGTEARTLHRLLGWQSDRFRFNARNPLQARLVIVDEASMVGLELLASLVEALRPEARLVLLGDAEQLPSVEAGSVFRDLVEALPECTARLTRSYRMDPSDPDGRAILQAANALREGQCGEDVLPGTGKMMQGAGFLEAGGRDIAGFLEAWAEMELWTEAVASQCQRPFRISGGVWAAGEEARLGDLFAHFGRKRILCPLRRSPGLQGVESVNAFLHEIWRSRAGGGLGKDLALLAGEPVMMRRNDYDRGLFNGDPGLVLLLTNPAGETHQAAVFQQGTSFTAFPVTSLLPDLELGYASTVHRSQGSEFDRVALILPREDSPLMTREILYTALTRARKSAVVLGDREILEQAAARQIHRRTNLGKFLA